MVVTGKKQLFVCSTWAIAPELSRYCRKWSSWASYWRGTKSSFTSKVSVLSAGAYFHCFTASVAASTRIGLPPTGVTAFTFPAGVTTIDNLTTPPISWVLRYSGYFGATRVTSFRGAGSSARTRGARIATLTAKQKIRNARAQLRSKEDEFHEILVVKAHAPIQTIWG